MSRLLRMLAVLLLLGGALPAGAQSVDAYTVRGIEVDVTAASILAAKEQALANAQASAFRQLVERLATPASLSRLPLDKVKPVEYVRDFAIEQEKSSTVRYIATLTVRFNPAAIRKLFKDAGQILAEPRNRAVVVIPVLKTAERTALWDDPNPWRGGWAAVGAGGLVPLVLPSGDLADVTAITADQAVALEPQALDAVGRRYGSPDVLVAVAEPKPGAVEVNLSGTIGAPRPFAVKSFPLAAGESPEAALARAAAEISRAMDSTYKQGAAGEGSQGGQVPVIARLGGLSDWLSLRERLGRVSQVRRYEIVSLARDEAALMLTVVGEVAQLQGAMATAGLVMQPGSGYWTVMLSGSRQ